MDRVWAGLYVASIDEVRENPTGRFDAVVSVCQDTCHDNLSEHTEHANVPLADDCGSEYRWGGEFSYQRFDEAVNEVVRHLFDGDTTLVHCHKGKNRSIAVAIAAYAIWRGTTFTDSRRAVMSSRSVADPDEEQLAFARHCIGNNLRGSSR